MKKKIVSIVLVVSLAGLILPGCSAGRINELEAQISELEAQVAELEAQIAEREADIAEREAEIVEQAARISEIENQAAGQSAQMKELEVRMAKLEKEKSELQEEVDNLKKPVPEIEPKKVIGTLTREELHSRLEEFYPRARIEIVDGKYQLVSLETLRNFLAVDGTDRYRWREDYYDCDDFAFRLKGQWIKAGFASCPLGVLRGERTLSGKQVMHWCNILITKENDNLVLYEVEPQTDRIIRVREPNLETFIIVM